MPNAFAGTKTDPNKVKDEERDSVGGGYAWDSDTYPVVISEAYPDKSAGGATSLNIIYKNKEGKEVTQIEWVQSGDAKGNSPTYDVRDSNGKPTGEKRKLLGLTRADSICALVAGKTLEQVGANTEPKVVTKWDPAASARNEKTVDMLMDLVGQSVIIGVQKKIVDKRAKGEDGQYHPTGEVRTINEVDKVFDGVTGRTLTEVRAELKEPVFIHTWRTNNRGKVQDDSSKASGSTAKAGAPGAAPEGTKGLFE